MTTPKEALEELLSACDAVNSERVVVDPHAIEHARHALASLQGEDAVERVARIIDPDGFCSEPNPDESKLVRAARRHSAREKARAILATGLVPDEAAIRKGSDQ